MPEAHPYPFLRRVPPPPPPGGTDRAGSIPSAPGQSIHAQDCVQQSHDRVQMAVSQLARGIDTILFYCWPTVYDVGPALKQHWVNASCVSWDVWPSSLLLPVVSYCLAD